MSEPRYIAVEGPIGVGKTSLVKLIAEHTGARLVLEDVEENPFLREFYRDTKGKAFQTQLFFLLSRYHQQQVEFSQYDLFSKGVISDYLFAKDRIFAYQTLDENELKLHVVDIEQDYGQGLVVPLHSFHLSRNYFIKPYPVQCSR